MWTGVVTLAWDGLVLECSIYMPRSWFYAYWLDGDTWKGEEQKP